MAKRFFPGRNPIGMKFCFGGGDKVKPDITIVGIVRDINQDHVKSVTENPYVYIPYSQRTTLDGMSFYVNTERDPLQLASAMQSVVRDTDPNLPVYNLKTMDRIVEEDLFSARIVAWSLPASSPDSPRCLRPSASTAYSPSRRAAHARNRHSHGRRRRSRRHPHADREGSRLDADRGRRCRPAAGLRLARLSESLLFGVHAGNPVVYLVGLVLIAVVALVACYVPARRATRVDPLVALRYQ